MTVSVDQVVAGLRRRKAADAESARVRAQQIRAHLPAAKSLLAERYDATDVLLFGSLATGAARDTSDVDLAVKGLQADRYFDALADLMEIFGCPVDLVLYERAVASLRERIDAEGQLL